MLKKTLTIFSVLVISLFFLSFYGWVVKEISVNKQKYGFITEPIKFMYTFPDMFKQSVEEVKKLPGTFVKTPKNFKPINKLDQDVYALFSYSESDKVRAIIVKNLRNDSVVRKWTIANNHANIARIIHAMLLPDGSLVYGYAYKWSGIKRIDTAGNVIWEQKNAVFHHSKEFDKDGNIWASTAKTNGMTTGMYKLHKQTVFYHDQTITKIDAETGKILFNKSVSEILKENNLEYYLLKSPDVIDPLHLNDVEPALKTTEYYEEGDVFMSFRHISAIIHYRPSTNKVINVIEGPFVSQHDVDFLNDHTIAVFNNNNYVRRAGKHTRKPPKDTSALTIVGDFYSNIVTYDFRDESYSFIGDSIFRANKIFTYTEGLFEFIDDSTYFVEEQNSGVMWVIRDNEVIYKNVLKSQHEGYHHLLNWTRIIKNYD